MVKVTFGGVDTSLFIIFLGTFSLRYASSVLMPPRRCHQAMPRRIRTKRPPASVLAVRPARSRNHDVARIIYTLENRATAASPTGMNYSQTFINTLWDPGMYFGSVATDYGTGEKIKEADIIGFLNLGIPFRIGRGRRFSRLSVCGGGSTPRHPEEPRHRPKEGDRPNCWSWSWRLERWP